MSELTTRLDHLEDAVRGLIEAPIEDAEIPDTAGRVRHLEIKLADYRRGLLAEAPEPVGTDYAIVESRTATRTFNPTRILSDVASALPGESLIGVLSELQHADAVRLQWQWQKLGKFFHAHGITMQKHTGPVDDGDDAHVGEVWKTTTRVTGREA